MAPASDIHPAKKAGKSMREADALCVTLLISAVLLFCRAEEKSCSSNKKWSYFDLPISRGNQTLGLLNLTSP